MKKFNLKNIFALFSLLFLSSSFLGSCSLFESKSELTPELQMTLANISNQYLFNITTNNFDKLQPMIIWKEYSKKLNSRNRDLVIRQMEELDKKFKDDSEHPLKNISIEDISVDENDAKVLLRQLKNSKSSFEIHYYWVGDGWLITDDTVFGPGNLIAEELKN